MIRFQSLFSTTVVISVLCLSAAAQDQPQFPTPEKEHQWLKQFVGEWSTSSKASMGPDQPPIECSGKISSHMLGAFWVVNEMNGELNGDQMRGLQTIGYDAAKKKYVGTWVDSMTDHIWHYEGTVDESGKKLTLEAEGPDFAVVGKTTQYRDAYEFTSPNHIIITSSMLSQDGKWVTFMTGDAKRATTKPSRSTTE